MKRFSALVAALMLCAALCVPCFASNNASTKKWVVAAESNFTNESGTSSRYLKLTPYVGGNEYAAVFTSSSAYIRLADSPNAQYSEGAMRFLVPVNYPDWWRADIPLGARSYVSISSARVISYVYQGSSHSAPSTVLFYPINSSYGIDLSTEKFLSNSSASVSLSSSLFAYPVSSEFRYNNNNSSYGSGTVTLAASYFSVPVASSSPYVASINDLTQIVATPVPFQVSSQATNFAGLYWGPAPVFNNLSSSQLLFCVSPPVSSTGDNPWTLSVSAVVSFWVDANKLPAGLQVGDEFPADTDAFDQLRDDLIDQFPEAFENIQNGKATIEGWNDTETVDTDVASTSISALNALFQNLGGFLFIVSLMVFGAVVLRMLIRKAVDG